MASESGNPLWNNCIFSIFKMAAAAILNFRNSQILLPGGSRASRCLTMPNIIKIHQSVAELLSFFNFLKDGGQ